VSLVGHHDVLAGRDDAHEVEGADALAVGPAPAEERLPVEPIVQRTGEMEVVGQQLFRGCAVLGDEGAVQGPGDFGVVHGSLQGAE
jgi:hypothetical protein